MTQITSTAQSLSERIGTDLAFPINGNFQTVTGLDLLLQDIQLLLLTTPGERVNNPNYGCGLKNQLWENIDEAFSSGKKNIATAINTYEPRVTLTLVTGTINRNTDLIMFTIKFIVNATNSPVNLVFPFRSAAQLASA